MNCREAAELITAYVDDELDAEESATLVEHLSECWSCRERLVFEQELCVSLRQNHCPMRCSEHLRKRIADSISREGGPSHAQALLPLLLLAGSFLVPLLIVLLTAACLVGLKVKAAGNAGNADGAAAGVLPDGRTPPAVAGGDF